ncbi:MAG: C/D box methylation guide ribonucleoprotein complex aNOP56 subunit [Candidatus Bathyarchaeia archaeon]|jgi:nucleolar protein 56|nr:C/D box methylation guide ribonucleoprotein complex aNOP56 subunit [Candidatus Bathyarchaeota archaeon A05DMB-4]MDH7595820.1 C/D box methylation guide ribonucleoprotein complex aNOP56 subunit [Candidatus Bathyarchaeota archaeon]
MKAKIVGSILGFFAFDETNRLIDKVLFRKDADMVAEKIFKSETGVVVEELQLLLKKLVDEGYGEFALESSEIGKNVKELFNVQVEAVKLSSVESLLNKSMAQFAVDAGFVRTSDEFRDWVRDVSVALTKRRVRVAVEKRDLMVAQVILSIDDLDKTVNLFMSRIREWYGLHFPELDGLLERHETYARLVLNLGARENFTLENLEKEGLPRDKAQQIANAATSSMGAAVREDDMKQVKELCKTTLGLYEVRQALEAHIDSAMSEVAPNITAVVGSLLGARLIAVAGGLTNLAKMPASTIQVLGAEKALFRALKTGARPPKHGLLFQHASIHEAARWQRGKVARALAGKIAIAARIDAYGGKYVGDELKADLERRIKGIHEKYVEPPSTSASQWQKPKETPSRRFKRGRKR